MSGHITKVEWNRGVVVTCSCGWFRGVSTVECGPAGLKGYPEGHRIANEHEDRQRAYSPAPAVGAP